MCHRAQHALEGLQVVKALVPHIGGPRTYPKVVDLSDPKETRPLGPCLVLNVIAGIPDGARHFKSVWGETRWQERAAAVLAYLTEAGLEPSIYPGEDCHQTGTTTSRSRGGGEDGG